MEYTMLGCALRGRGSPPKHQLEIRRDNLSNCLNSVYKDWMLLAIPKSTSTHHQSMNDTSKEQKTMATSQKSTQKNYQTLTASSVASLVRHLASQENDGDSMIPEVRSFLTSHGFLGKSNHAILSLRTSKGFYLTTKETLSAPSLPRLMNWGTTVNGVCLTAKTSVFPKTGKGSTLSDILEEHPDPKYSLSSEQTEKILASSGKMLRTLLTQTTPKEQTPSVKDDEVLSLKSNNSTSQPTQTIESTPATA